MIFLLFFYTILYARDLPEKEITRRCNLEKVQACVIENQTIVSDLTSKEISVQKELETKNREKDELHKLRSPIVESIQMNEIRQFFLQKLTNIDAESEKNSNFGQIFSDGPLLSDHGKLSFSQVNEQTTDKIRLQRFIENEQVNLSQSQAVLEKDFQLFSSKIQTVEQSMEEKKYSLSQLQTLKHRHVVMCEFGCKSKFCPEN